MCFEVEALGTLSVVICSPGQRGQAESERDEQLYLLQNAGLIVHTCALRLWADVFIHSFIWFPIPQWGHEHHYCPMSPFTTLRPVTLCIWHHLNLFYTLLSLPHRVPVGLDHHYSNRPETKLFKSHEPRSELLQPLFTQRWKRLSSARWFSGQACGFRILYWAWALTFQPCDFKDSPGCNF